MISPNVQAGRTLGATARRHGLLLLALFCLVASACFVLAPLIGRRYSVHSQMGIALHPLEGMPELRAVPQAALKELSGRAAAAGIDMTISAGDADTSTVHMAATAGTREGPLAQMQFLGDQLHTTLSHRAEELASAHRAELLKQSDRLAAQEDSLAKQIEQYRLAHRGVLPDDPSSVTAQFEKLSNRLDESQQRQRSLVEMITRLKASKLAPTSPATPLPQDAAPAASASTASVRPDADPEVLSLNAQLQIVNDMLDDDLNKKHRTEQHPDVVDLRDRQATLQKQIDAAKDRAAAGKPPPANVHPAGTAGGDPSLAAAQALDMQIQALQAEVDTLDSDVKTFTSQRDALQKTVDDVMPVRRGYENLANQLAGAQKDHQTVTAALAQYDRSFPAGESPEASLIDISALQVAPDSALPAFPQMPLVYGVSILLAAVFAAAAAWLLFHTDRTLHTSQQAAAILEVPILGSVMELRAAGSAMRQRLWRTFLRPVLAIGMLLLTISSGVLCYRHLADSEFAQSVHARGLGAILSNGHNTPEGRG